MDTIVTGAIHERLRHVGVAVRVSVDCGKASEMAHE
jgi:hypothetical protein